MHDIEPYYKWRESYVASEDEQSPFFGKNYDEFTYRNKVYNYFIHPQWDSIGTETLYIKVIFIDYDEGYAIIDLIGEWNDCLHNDVMFLKRNVIDKMVDAGIMKFILICGNVLNFHGSDNSYYEEWFDDIKEDDGWIVYIDSLEHVKKELENQSIHFYVNFGEAFDDINWRKNKPQALFDQIKLRLNQQTLSLH